MGFPDNDDNDGGIVPRREHKSDYDLNSRIMLTAIVSLSVVVVLVIILHVYARCILRRQARRRTTIRRLGLSTASAQAHTEPPKTGLEPAVIASLPIFTFKKTGGGSGGGGDDDNGTIECAVCLSMLEEDEIARLLPNCKHTFHAECIDKWLSSHSTCPICRTEAEPRMLRPENREAPILMGGGAMAAPPPPTAPPLAECSHYMEGTSSESQAKVVGGSSSSRFSSFRRILSRERSSRRIQIQSCGEEDGVADLERQ